ncbi:MAG: hypothetical protein KDD67_05720 [Ignavibacteriae bacterium]|nr:hypothetical protein [Ignavibacteriota bacterium]
MFRLSLIFLSGIILCTLPLIGQNTVTGSEGSDVVKEKLPLYRWPYAAKYAPRIGGSGESEGDKVRLDIGGTIPLLEAAESASYVEMVCHSPICGNDDFSNYLYPIWEPAAINFSAGIDFFTWSRLRSEANFKFPVEAVDYYFGFYGSMRIGKTGDSYTSTGDGNIKERTKHRTTIIPTLRIAHISAHLVDGEPQFALPNEGAVVYSREFVDLSCGLEHFLWLGLWASGGSSFEPTSLYVRPYIGTQLLFHTIPGNLGKVTPYIGGDLEMQLFEGLKAPTLRTGYEFRLNTETKTFGEHSLRAGIKLAPSHHNGILLEAAYYSGRSQFGQYFQNRENYFSLGFGFGM